MARTYNQQNSDGSWWQVHQDDNGNYSHTVIPDPTAAPAGDAPTGNGSLSVAQMRAALQDPRVGYTGPWDDASVTAAYNRTVNGGNAGATAPGAGGAGTPEAFNPAYYGLVQQGIDQTIKNALAAANGQVSAAVAAANNIRGLIQTYGDQALSFLHEAGTLGVSVADVMSRLTGPANFLAYDRAATAFRGNGLGDSAQALTSGFTAPAFGAMGPTSPMTLATLGQDVSGQAPGSGPGIVDQLLGLAGTAEQGYQNAGKGQVPFAIPQLDANGHVIPSTAQGNQVSPPPAGGSAGLYQTSNGPKTVAQMLAELDVAAGGQWKDGDRNSATAIASAYAHTTGGTVTPPQTAPQAPTLGQNAPVLTDRPTTLTPSAPSLGQTAPTAGPGFTVPTPQAKAASQFAQMTGTDTIGPGPFTGSAAYLNQYSPQAQQYLFSLPSPSAINPRDFAAMDPSAQARTLAGEGAKGYDPTQVQFQLDQELPKATGPKFGLVA